jgi:hypothetical protein
MNPKTVAKLRSLRNKLAHIILYHSIPDLREAFRIADEIVDRFPQSLRIASTTAGTSASCGETLLHLSAISVPPSKAGPSWTAVRATSLAALYYR